MDKFQETYVNIISEMSNKKAKKNIIKEQTTGKGALPSDFDRNAPFYEIELFMYSYNALDRYDFDGNYKLAIEQAEKDFTFLSQFSPKVNNGRNGSVCKFIIPRERLVEFAKYPLYGNTDNGLIGMMSNGNVSSADINNDTTIDEIFDAMVINTNNFDYHFIINPTNVAGKASSADLQTFRNFLIDIDEESWADNDFDDEE